MFWRFIFSALLAASIVSSGTTSAQFTGRTGLVSSGEAQRYGLTRAWFTQIDVDRARGNVSHISQHISKTRTQTIYQVVHHRGVIEISERQVDKFGDQLGQIGAVKLAAERIGDIIDNLQKRKPEGVDLGALMPTDQAADQVLQNIKDLRIKQKLSPEPVPVEIESIVSPLLRRNVAAPEGLPRLERLVVPDTTLFMTTDQGMVHAIDGETGRTRWTVPVGKPGHPNLTPAANDRLVAVINGSKLNILSNDTGALVWQRVLKGVPGAGPAITDNMVFIPTVRGVIESYRLYYIKTSEDGDGENYGDERKERYRFQTPSKFMSTGRGLIRPIATEASVAWPTDRGYFYVSDNFQLKQRFRLVANDTIVAPASHMAPNHFFVASIDGYVYSVHEMNGDLNWRFSAGVPISQTPIPLGDSVYVITDDGGMFRVLVANGQEEWWTPDVKQFVSASANRLYCLDDVGRMLVIDIQTGGLIARLGTERLDLHLINYQSDRIYIGTKSGLLQCLHETPIKRPLFHTAIEIKEQEKDPKKDKPDKGGDPKPADPADPFGGGKPVDPFGGGKPVDPFGGGKDPFGGGGAKPADPGGDKKPADPFGGGADPFGG